ncbi:probable amino acid permease 7 [Camellia sinensis]|uniref:probable amino acid permease 7 n=1 Tax=Camellia sinensis TaxID=4442 RepID=UPI001035E410|nr:probable amino acid permease 7 [Camellia sinensis]
MSDKEDEQAIPLLLDTPPSSSSVQPNGPLIRTGEKSMWVCGALVQESYYGYGVAYTITAAISMRAIQKSNCYHKEGYNAP